MDNLIFTILVEIFMLRLEDKGFTYQKLLIKSLFSWKRLVATAPYNPKLYEQTVLWNLTPEVQSNSRLHVSNLTSFRFNNTTEFSIYKNYITISCFQVNTTTSLLEKCIGKHRHKYIHLIAKIVINVLHQRSRVVSVKGVFPFISTCTPVSSQLRLNDKQENCFTK